jgi:hypothetical protein
MLLCGGLLGLQLVGGEPPPALVVRGRVPMLVGVRLLLLLLQQPADVGILVVMVPPLLLLLLLLPVVAVVLRLMVGGRLLLLVLVWAWPHLGVLVLLRRVQLLVMLHVLVPFGDRRLSFLLGDIVLLLVYGGLQLGVLFLLLLLVVPLLLVVGVLHVGSLRLLVLFCGWLLRHLLTDIETLLVGRVVTLMFVLYSSHRCRFSGSCCTW